MLFSLTLKYLLLFAYENSLFGLLIEYRFTLYRQYLSHITALVCFVIAHIPGYRIVIHLHGDFGPGWMEQT